MKHSIIKISFIIAGLIQIVPLNLFGQNQKIPVDKLHKDIKFYFSTLKKVHPNVYAYTNSQILDSVERNLIQKINTPLTSLEFATQIELETNYLFDSHTRLYKIFDNPMILSYPDSCQFFPWKIKIDQDNIYLEDKNLNLGKVQIMEINQHPVNEILSNIRKIFSADISEINKAEQIEKFFAFYYYLIYKEYTNFQIDIIDKYNEKQSVLGPGISKFKVKESINNQYIIKRTSTDFQLDFFADTIALLTINTFRLSSNNQYEQFLNKSFEAMAKQNCKYLFIDIKDNYGGSSNQVDLLLNYLFSDHYKFFGCISERRYSKEYVKYLRQEERKSNGKSVQKYDKALEYITEYSFWEREFMPEHAFNGFICILQGYKTASASVDLSCAIRTSRRGLLAGKPTGEPASMYSQSAIFEMPYSKLSFQCATSFFIMPTGSINDDKWVQPDIIMDFEKVKIDKASLQHLIKTAQKEFPSYFPQK